MSGGLTSPWPSHHTSGLITGSDVDEPPGDLSESSAEEIEPWMTSLLADEHVSLLVGALITCASEEEPAAGIEKSRGGVSYSTGISHS